MRMPTKILVPTDFREYSDRALEQALDIAKQYKAKVFLLHVLPEEIHHTIAFDFGLSEDLWRQITTTQRYCRVSNLNVKRDYYKAIEVVMQRAQSPKNDAFELDKKWIQETRV